MAAIRPNPTLSEDLLSEILVRVPVKSLLCFRSVSKTWLSLIKHPSFVRSQLRHAITTQTHQTLIISRLRSYLEKKFSLLRVDSREIVADFEFPYSRGALDPAFVGSANGIVCVAITVSVTANLKTSIYLWNPAIRQSKLIPSSFNSSDNNITPVEIFGFGYDGVDHDFKVVRVVGLPFDYAADATEVYSANKNAWRNVPEAIDFPSRLAFEINMWTLDDDACLRGGGVEAWWTPLFSIDSGRPTDLIHGYFSNGNLLLVLLINDVKMWISCNIDKKEAKIVPLSFDMADHRYDCEIYKYTESLVSLEGFRHVN